MKAVIFAGGFGTRLSEETKLIPKPLVKVGEHPVLWHIMKIYAHYGVKDFVICLGYKGYKIKDYFINYHRHLADLTVNLSDNSIDIHNSKSEDWKVTLVDTGQDTMTGGRLKRVGAYLDDNEDFCLTYGDGVADINIKALIEFHKAHKKLATVTAVQPAGRFGALDINANNLVEGFVEKPKGDGNYINGGFFVMNKKILDYIAGDDTVFEQEPLKNLAKNGEMKSFKHAGFWQPMDTLRDKHALEELWQSGAAPWKVWKAPSTKKSERLENNQNANLPESELVTI